jgi:peptide/nickel transport system substrate-binding protein
MSLANDGSTRRAFLKYVSATTAAASLTGGKAFAQARGDTLLVVQELGANSLDMQGAGSNQTVNGLSWNCYDRLMTYASKTLADGTPSYDRMQLAPELAESWEVAADGMSCTFKLRKDATFHDGTPVTAKDVKWSFDRAVKIGGFPTFQMSAGSLEKPEQFVVVDDHTFRVDYLRKDKMLLFNLGRGGAVRHQLGTGQEERDGGGSVGRSLAEEQRGGRRGLPHRELEARQRDDLRPLRRMEEWPAAKIRRIIAADVPSAGTRRAMLEKGDADLSTGFPPKDFDQLIKEGKVKVVAVPIPNCLWYLALNTAKPPFDNPKLRQAVAWATPYEQIQTSAFFNRAVPMYGGPASVDKAVWPQPFPYVTNLDRAKELMTEAGLAQGIDATLSLDVGTATVGEPTAILIQESLAKIGIRVTIDKIPAPTGAPH